jgi:outer membrane receptor protein involved in Fe transport
VSPEYVNDFELGARYQTDFFSAGLNLYREDFTNTFISQYDPATGLSSTVNGGASRYQGVELQLQGDTGHQAWGDMHGYLNFAYNDAKFTKSFTIGDTTSFAAFGSVTAGQPLAGVPDYLVTGGVVWSYMGWRLNAEGRYVGRQYLDQQVAGTPSSTTIPSYFLVDLGVSKTIDLAHAGMGVKAIKFSVNANNLFDKYYLNQGYTNGGLWAIPGAPRSVIGTIEAQF